MLKANLVLSLNYTGENLAKLNRALLLLEEVMNSERFKNAVLDFYMPDGKKTFHFKTYKWRLLGRKETRLKEYSNAEVYIKIMKGQSGNSSDRFMNFKTELNPGDSSIIDDPAPNDDIIHTYESELKTMSDERFAGQLAHEYCHMIGFDHSDSSKSDSLRDCYSVPYAIGNIVEIILNPAHGKECDYIPF